ncbi:MAG: Ig-like domain-containing protein, partial [Flavobacteriaceae bacterium]|nr:Ig-like domain-containing protein [Flavobacteriaceae bacterium]
MNTTFRNFLLVFSAVLLFSNCAKKGMPDGGPKDSIPPVIVKSNPENFTTQFTGDEIRIYFDEYIKLKDLQQNLIISPPLKYQPLITPLSTSKVLKIKILDTLKENTTYSINFGKSIVDNNEENEFEYFKYIFSTGTYIDSLNLKGNIKHSLLRKPVEATTIMLYEFDDTFNDSIVFTEKPTYIATTRDSTNTFELTNLKEGKYRLIALNESTNNYTFEPEKDEIGFVAETISIPTDSGYTMKIFKEIPDYKITRPNHISKHKIIFGYEGRIDSLEIDPISNLPEDWETWRFKETGKDTINYLFKPEIDIEVTDT